MQAVNESGEYEQIHLLDIRQSVRAASNRGGIQSTGIAVLAREASPSSRVHVEEVLAFRTGSRRTFIASLVVRSFAARTFPVLLFVEDIFS